MKTVRLTMAQALVRFLENQYMEVDGAQHRFVRGVFIIPGHGNVVGLGQALSQEAKHLEIYQGKNEQGMAQAAVAFAKDSTDFEGMLDALLAAAREALAGILANYRGWRRCEIILVFDAYKVKGNPGSMEKKSGIYIVYTKEAQTADSYIERATYDLGKNHRVRVATSDNMEQVIILGHGALRISARAFEEEVAEAEGQISDLIERWNVRDFDLRRVRATATIIDKKEEKGS